MKALDIVLDEHRSIAAVLQGLRYLVDEIAARRDRPDFPLFDAMFAYIEAFPERLHHPKEDRYLFPALRKRSPESAAALDKLEHEHVAGREHLEALRASLEDYRRSSAAFDAFRAKVSSYAEFHWRHMRLEEDEVVPAARAKLTDDDWKEIDEAFESNRDPLVGANATREMRELFRRIVSLAPPPIGVGPDHSNRR